MKISRKKIEKIISRGFSSPVQFDRAKADADARTIPVTISSEAPILEYGTRRVLLHSKKAIDMSRAGSEHGLPLRIDHSGKLIGRIKNIRITRDKRLAGIAHFSPNSQEADEAWREVNDGFLVDTSVQGDILEIGENFENDDNVIEITRWKPVEGSIVTVPADESVGVNRSKRISKMPGKKPTEPKAPKGDDLKIADFEAARKAGRGEGFRDGEEAATKRIKTIYRSFDPFMDRSGVADLCQTCIDEGTSAERSHELLLEWIGKDTDPAGASRRQSEGNHGRSVETIEDESDKWIAGVTRALEVKAGLEGDREKARTERRANEFISMSLQELSRDYLVRQSVKVAGLDRMALVGQSFTRAGQFGTSDFANVLGNVASKAMLIGYEEAAETWRTWCKVGSLSDFKIADRVNLSSFSDLASILESEEYKTGGISDLKETIQLGTYGRIFPISRQAIINDDLQAFSDIPRKMGRAANAKVGDVAYALLTGNPTLNQDSTALFHADHNNLGTTGAISEVTLDELGKLMAAQTSPAPRTGETGRRLNISPKYLLVPRALLMSATKTIRTVTAPVQGTNTGDLTVNTQFGMWEPVWDGRLDAASVTQYYAAADQNMFDTVEVAFLDGVDEPFLDSEDGWSIDGVEYKVRIDVAGAVRDFRGLARNATA